MIRPPPRPSKRTALTCLVSPSATESTSVSLVRTLPVASCPGVPLLVPPASMAVATSPLAIGVSLVSWMSICSIALLVRPPLSTMV
ncbi:hypothetical protein D3C76_1705650 [compost metagenome]